MGRMLDRSPKAQPLSRYGVAFFDTFGHDRVESKWLSERLQLVTMANTDQFMKKGARRRSLASTRYHVRKLVLAVTDDAPPHPA